MKKFKLIIFLIIMISFLSIPIFYTQAYEEYCIWQIATTNSNPCNAPGDTTDYFIADSTGQGCAGKTKDPGENICCCQVKDRPGQCSASNPCPSGQVCVDNWCQNPAVKTPKFNIPSLQIEIPGLDKLSDVNCTIKDGGYQCKIPWIGEYIAALYNYGLSIAGILAAVVLMAGGILWLISGGDASRITQAKELIIGSVTGLVILAASYVLLIQINPDLIRMKPIKIGYIEKIEAPEGDKTIDQQGTKNRATTEYIIIHTAAGLSTRNEVDEYHKSLGWNGIGYNFYIERNGSFVVGRGENVYGAHSIKYNSNSIGISYAGCYKTEQHSNETVQEALDNDTITQSQLNTLIEKIKFYQNKYNIPREKVLGHYEEPVSKACPCLPMDEIRKLINP